MIFPIWCYGNLTRINGFQLLNSPLFQLPAHHSGQRTNRSLINVCYFKSSRIQLISGSHGTNDRCTAFLRLHSQLYLTSYSIYGICHIIILGKIKHRRCIWHKKSFPGMNHYIRINRQNSFLGCLYFIFPNCLLCCYNLPIQIRQTYFIIINQIQGAHTASGEGFYCVTADTPDTKDCHSCSCQLLHILLPQQKPGP